MPIGKPPRATATPTPTSTTTHDSAMACHRHLTKLKLAFSKMCFMGLNTQSGCLAPRQHELEHRARHEDRRKDVRRQSDRQRGGKTTNRAGAKLIQERGSNQ